jgi:PAS domain S-box-containing protein
VAIALLNTWLLYQVLSPAIFALFYGAVALSSWYGGMKPGLLATALSTVAINYFFMAPQGSLAMTGVSTLVRLGVFLFVTLVITSLSAESRAAKERAEVSLLKLRASEERYRRIIETAYEGIWIIDAEGKTDYVNQRMAEMLGYRVEEMAERSIFEFVNSEERPAAEQLIERWKQGIKEQFDFRYRCKDGSDLWVIVSANPIMGEQGEFKGAIAMLTDVTSRKQTEEELKRYQLLSENSRDIVLFLRCDGQIIEANNAAIKAYGYDKAELLSLKIDALREPPTHALIAEQMKQADAQGILFETNHRRQDGTLFPVEVSAKGSTIGNERVILSIIRDITLRKQALVALRESEERYRAFIEQSSEGIWRFELERSLSLDRPEDEQIDHCYQYGYLAECNNAMAQMYGFERAEDIVGARLGDFLVRSNTNNIEYLRAFIRSGYRMNDAESQEIDNLGNSKYFLNNLVGIIENNLLVRAWGSQRDITERKLAEEALRESQERARRLVDSNIIGVIFGDFSGNIVEVNDAFLKIIGYTREDLLSGKVNWIEITPPEQRYLDIEAREEMQRTGTHTPFEKEYIRKDGSRVPVLVGTAYLGESKDNAVGFVLDLSARKQAEESSRQLAKQIQEQADTLDAILAASVDHIYIFDREGRYKYVSAGGAKAVGYEPLDLVGKTWRDIGLSEEIVEQFETHKKEVMASGQPVRNENEFSIYSGVKHYEYIMTPLYNRDKNVEGLVVVSRDATDRKQAEQALRESEERFRKLSEKVRVIPWEADPISGRFTYVGPQSVDLLGYPLEEWYADNFWSDRIHPEDRELTIKFCNDSSAYLDNYEFEYRMVKADGQTLWLYDLVNVVRDEDGPKLLRGFMIDITERKRAESEREQLLAGEQSARAEAEAANRMKDEFLATLSHELRTPLNAMLGWTQLLRTRKFDQTTIQRALETIDRNTKSLAQLIEDVLDVSRIITGKLRLNIRPVALVSVIQAAIETVAPASEAKNIQIEPILDHSAGAVLGDANRLQQVVWNLLSNAVKFTPKGGRVAIILERSNSQIQIKVSDTGQGISPDFLPYVFERFRQADGATTRSHGGLGLGLAIVRHLVELHGGTACAESEGEGKGATFIVTLPLMAVRPPSIEPHQAQPTVEDEAREISPPSLDGLRVLVVDDEPDARELIATMLAEYGADVTAVDSAGAALEALQQLNPNILVSDIGMPQEDGYSLIRKVRALDAAQGGRIPAVALTAYARAEDRTQALLSGFQLHVPKPVNPAELAAVVANLVGRSGNP